MSERWGPWTKHDGRGCPVPVGTFVCVESLGRPQEAFVAGCDNKRSGHIGPHGNENKPKSCWVWSKHPVRNGDIIRYRIRKPKGLTILERIASQPQERVEA